jgi:hypothetical protein
MGATHGHLHRRSGVLPMGMLRPVLVHRRRLEPMLRVRATSDVPRRYGRCPPKLRCAAWSVGWRVRWTARLGGAVAALANRVGVWYLWWSCCRIITRRARHCAICVPVTSRNWPRATLRRTKLQPAYRTGACITTLCHRRLGTHVVGG